jgi:membrane fusion protein (multidrug efflux system)
MQTEQFMKTKTRSISPSRLVSALCCSLLLLGGCKQEANHSESGQQPPPPQATVQMMTVNQGQTGSQNEVVGTLEAVQRATVSAKVTGTIAEMPVTLGAAVKQGDLLVKLNVTEISARLSQAETAVAQAKRNLDREERLLAKSASTRETVSTMKDAYHEAQAAQTEARTMLGYATLRAPFSGQVASKLANAGDMATAGAPLLVLENAATLQAVAAVPEELMHTIKPGNTLKVVIPAAGVETTGTVAEIAPAADASSRTATIKLNLAHDPALRPGQFARVILPGRATTTLLVPESAVSAFGQMERLFVVNTSPAKEGQSTVQLRLVRTGLHRDGQTEILSGLDSGEQVVVQANSQLIDGQTVRIAP